MAARAEARRALSYGMAHFVAGRTVSTRVGRSKISVKAPGKRQRVSKNVQGRYASNVVDLAEERAVARAQAAAVNPVTAAVLSKPRTRRRRMIVGARRQANLPAPNYVKSPRIEAKRRSAVHNGLYRTVGTRRPVRTRRDSKGRYAGSY